VQKDFLQVSQLATHIVTPLLAIAYLETYNVVTVDSDTDGSDGTFQLVARMGESLSSTASIFSIIGGRSGLNGIGRG
jgi:N-acetylglutamate synthase/N-acetylornithine aminotransferase